MLRIITWLGSILSKVNFNGKVWYVFTTWLKILRILPTVLIFNDTFTRYPVFSNPLRLETPDEIEILRYKIYSVETEKI